VKPLSAPAEASGINDSGQIVANADDTATGQTHALLLNPS
jgi:probable HAF family extracellular repeat protein